MASENQLKANRENATKSTGPRTEEGKAKSSLNGLKNALTGRTVLLPDDDVEVYQAHVARIESKYFAAETDEERILVQSIADTEWRLMRITELESGYYAAGHLEFAPQLSDQPAEVRKVLIQTRSHEKYMRQLTNLSIQESRLSRKLEKDKAALEALLAPREKSRRFQMDDCAKAYLAQEQVEGEEETKNLAHWRNIGFVFSTNEWIECLVNLVAFQDRGPRCEIRRMELRNHFRQQH